MIPFITFRYIVIRYAALYIFFQASYFNYAIKCACGMCRYVVGISRKTFHQFEKEQLPNSSILLNASSNSTKCTFIVEINLIPGCPKASRLLDG